MSFASIIHKIGNGLFHLYRYFTQLCRSISTSLLTIALVFNKIFVSTLCFPIITYSPLVKIMVVAWKTIAIRTERVTVVANLAADFVAWVLLVAFVETTRGRYRYYVWGVGDSRREGEVEEGG